MAKVEGFAVSDETYYKLYKGYGVDVRYWKGIPVVGVITKKRSRKTTGTTATRQYQTQQNFRIIGKIWKGLSPTWKRFYSYEARRYDMTGKDLFFFLYLAFYDQWELAFLYWNDVFFYYWNDQLFMDLLATMPYSVYITKFKWETAGTRKHEKQRGKWKRCKRPLLNPGYGVIEQILAYSNNTYNVPLNYTTSYEGRFGPLRYYYPYTPLDKWAIIINDIEQKWAPYKTRYFPIGTSSETRIAHIRKHHLEAASVNMAWVGSLQFQSVPNWQQYKRLIIERVGNPVRINDPSKQLTKDETIVRMFFGQARISIPYGHPWAVLPSIPAGYSFPRTAQIIITTGLFHNCPAYRLTIPEIGKTSIINIAINLQYPSYYAFKLVKGPYFRMRYQFPNPNGKEQYALMHWTGGTIGGMRISPVFTPKQAKRFAFKIPPPTLATYDNFPYWKDLGPLNETVSWPKEDIDKGKRGKPAPIIKEDLPDGQNAILQHWNTCRQEHEARNPGESYWWNEEDPY